MATVLVVGAQGCLGTLVVNELSQRGWNVLRGGRHPDRADDFRLIDLDDSSTWNPALVDVDIAISTVSHPELPLERHILETGGLLLNPATIPCSYLQRLATSAGLARGTVVAHAGLTPGLGTLLAAELLRSHPQASEIAIGVTFSGLGTTGEQGARWTFSHFVESERSKRRMVPLPPPMGDRICGVKNLANEGWLATDRWPPVQRFEFCMAEKSLDLLLRGLARTHLLPLLGRIYAPIFGKRRPVPTDEQIFQWASVREPSGLEQGLLISARGDYRSTAIAVAIFAELLWSRAASSELAPGLVRIQDVLELNDVKGIFEERGISICNWNPRYSDKGQQLKIASTNNQGDSLSTDES